jgi:hypothetical protein
MPGQALLLVVITDQCLKKNQRYVGHGSGCICENKGKKAEFYSERRKMQEKLVDFFERGAV